MKRKETFGTSGVRVKVRMFAGWNYPKDMTHNADWVKAAYDGGVPMGGDLSAPNGASAPTLLVHALKDPNSGNLYCIAFRSSRFPPRTARARKKSTTSCGAAIASWTQKLEESLPSENTVDIKTATFTNSIGAPELIGQWTDPSFDPQASVTYYARVLEIPTPRWSNRPGREAQPAAKPRCACHSSQQRAWTSPIWYTPTK